MIQSSPSIHSESLCKSFGRVQALRDLNLSINQGEIYGFLGPNGAGKTTTLRCMLDLIHPDSGAIRILGYDPQSDPGAVHAVSSYLPGELNLDVNRRVDNTLRYLNGLRHNQAEWSFITALAERLRLDLSATIRNLSRGNKQKVGVVQALMHRPKLLLLDEPTSGLDPLMQREVHALLREAQANGATVFFSSHNIAEVEAIADRVGIIRDGAIVEEAAPDHLHAMALRTVRITFERTVDAQALSDLVSVTEFQQTNDVTITAHVKGNLDSFIKALAEYPVSDMAVERPSLEEVLVAYYRDNATTDVGESV